MQPTAAPERPPARPVRSRLGSLDTLAKVLLGLIACLVIYPIARSVIGIFTDTATADGQAATEGIDSSILPVLGNTALMVGGGSLLALIGGATLAWINERTDGSFRGLGGFMPVAPLLLPGITGVLGWVVLLDPRVGLANGVLRDILGLIGIHPNEGPIDLYSMGGLIVVTGLHLVPIVYLVVSAALKNLDPAIEEASRISGARPLRTALRVTLPAIAPALARGWLLGVINGIGLFTVPVIIGTNARIEVVSVRIWRLLTNYPSRPDAALLLAAGMLVVILALTLVQRYLIPSGRQATISGRGVRAAPLRLGKLRHVARLLVIAYLLVALVLPILGLLIVSFSPFWSSSVPWSHLTTANFEFVLSDLSAFSALGNSLILAAVVASLAMLVTGFLMLNAHQRKGQDGQRRGGKKPKHQHGDSRRQKLVDTVTTLPATVPHSLIGVSFILAFGGAPFNLYGTVFILLLAYFTMEIPYAANSASAAVGVVGNELGEASRIFGASERRTLRKILLPLVLPGLAAGWVLVFIHVLGEVTVSSMLSGVSNPVVGSVLLDMWTQGNFPRMTAFAIIIWLIASLAVLIMLRLSNRRFTRATS